MTLPIYGVTPFTMQDFPQETACIVWFSGCNMRCTYCHNPSIVRGGKGTYPITKLQQFLISRQNKLSGVVFSGGEATSHPDIVPLAHMVKNLGFKLKLDTNGTRPQVIKALLAANLLDYVALDYKATPAKFKEITGLDKYNKFSETLDLLCQQHQTNFEIRTTIHTDLLQIADVEIMLQDLNQRNYTGTYYLQNFRHTTTLGNLPEQAQKLNLAALTKPTKFKIEARGF